MISAEQYKKITTDLHSVQSWQDYQNSQKFSELQPTFEKILGQPEIFEHTSSLEIKSSMVPLRVTSWNIERGMALDSVVDSLKNHPILSTSDVILLTEVDCGMARSGNRNVAGELSKRVGMNAVYVPCYFNLDQGNGAESFFSKGDNTMGLQGNAIMTRYPIHDVVSVGLPNTKDHLGGRERQIGQEYAIIAEIETPNGTVDAVCVHLAAHSSRAQRVEQVEEVTKALLSRKNPVILGGDFNTSTYNSNNAWRAILSFWRRVLMGNAITNHYPYPQNYFEKKLFQKLHQVGLTEKGYNVEGGCTLHYDFNDPFFRMSLEDWLPKWCFHFIDWALKPHNGKCSFKLDWFLGKGLTPTHTEIVRDLPTGKNRYSDHDPIVVDLQVAD